MNSLTEDQLTPRDTPRTIRMQSKVNRPYKERTERTSFPDQVCGMLSPIVYALNKGKTITPKSAEHKLLIELLTNANKV